MPVTARLSQKFYERFGDDIAGEFVDWFNAVDSTYQKQLYELNDLNWERFKAELRAAIAHLEAKLVEKISQSEARAAESEARSAEKIAQSEARLGDKIAHLEIRMGEKHSEMMKWMFLYWLGSLVPLGGLVVALLRSHS